MDMVGGIVEVLKRHQQKLDEHEQSLANIMSALEDLTAAIRESLDAEDDEPEKMN